MPSESTGRFVWPLLEELNHFHESVEESLASSSIQRYQQLYLYIGALLNMAVVWLSTGEKTSPEDMARFYLDAVHRMPGG